MASDSSACPHCISFTTPSDSDEEKLDDLLFSLDTHPSRDVIATGTITGNITLHSYSIDKDCIGLTSFNHHPGLSCRVLTFSECGNYLMAGSGGDKGQLSVTDVETGKLIHSVKKAHSAALYSMYLVSDHLLASGDELGGIKLWDTRSWKNTLHLKENTDFISCIASDDDRRTLLATSGDGRLSVFDLRQRKLDEQSDANESELLSLTIMKGGRKVVCGDGEGTLLLYHWGLWGDCTDRYPAHSDSVDSLLAIGDSVLCSGSSDGTVKSIQILPSEVLGIVGHHPAGLPIDNMSMTHDGSFLLTGSQDVCKFWSMESIPTLPGAGRSAEGAATVGEGGQLEEDEEDASWSKRKKRKRKMKHRHVPAPKDSRTADNFFSDLCS